MYILVYFKEKCQTRIFKVVIFLLFVALVITVEITVKTSMID